MTLLRHVRRSRHHILGHNLATAKLLGDFVPVGRIPLDAGAPSTLRLRNNRPLPRQPTLRRRRRLLPLHRRLVERRLGRLDPQCPHPARVFLHPLLALELKFAHTVLHNGNDDVREDEVYRKRPNWRRSALWFEMGLDKTPYLTILIRGASWSHSVVCRNEIK